MKTRLSWKLFGVLMLNTALLVAVLVLTMHHLVSRDFQGYVRETERERFQLARESFEDYYARFQSWDLLAGNPRLWRNLIRDSMMIHHEAMMEFGENEPVPLRRQRQQGGLSANSNRRRESARKQEPGMKGMASAVQGIPSAPETRMKHIPPSLMPMEPPIPFYPPPDPVRGRRRVRGLPLEGRLVVFDQHGFPILGKQRKTPPDLIETLRFQGEIIGRVEMYIPEALPNPRDQLFLSTLRRMLWILAGLMVGLSALFSLGLSWYLLRPVRRLTAGTHALAERRFETRVSITSTDELGQLAHDFNRMAETLEQFEQQRKQWLSDISHELGTPLSVMRGEIEAMQDGVRVPSPERLASLHAEVMQLSRIVEDLKLLNRAEAGRLELKELSFDPVRLLRDTLAFYEERFSLREITIDSHLDPGDDNLILGDTDRMRQVFVNVLENVLRYVDTPGNLSVKSQKDADRLTLSFTDSGPGVPEEMVPHLFDRFFRADHSRSRSTGGSGLGLAICKNLVEAHGGTIHACIAHPRGLCITLQLPLISAPRNEQ